MYLNLFIIGPSGCGKSTQARLLAQKYGLTHFSAGQLLRDEIASGSELGIKAKVFVDQGLWVPAELIIDLIKTHIDKISDQNFIIDGFPRQVDQGIAIAQYLESIKRPMTCLIHLDVSFEEIMNRRKALEVTGERFSDPNRSDETPESILHRQKSYDATIEPITSYFINKHVFMNINGNRAVSAILGDICQEIDKILTVNKIQSI